MAMASFSSYDQSNLTGGDGVDYNDRHVAKTEPPGDTEADHRRRAYRRCRHPGGGQPAAERHRFLLAVVVSTRRQATVLIGGELHPARIPMEYWGHRIRMAKAMGCNTIACYIFWNYHEPEEGRFDFQTENRDIARFIRTCAAKSACGCCSGRGHTSVRSGVRRIASVSAANARHQSRCMDTRYMAAVEPTCAGWRR